MSLRAKCSAEFLFKLSRLSTAVSRSLLPSLPCSILAHVSLIWLAWISLPSRSNVSYGLSFSVLWSNSTVDNAMKIQYSCRATGYTTLLDMNYPLPYGGPQLSRQEQVCHGNTKFITARTNPSQQKQNHNGNSQFVTAKQNWPRWK